MTPHRLFWPTSFDLEGETILGRHPFIWGETASELCATSTVLISVASVHPFHNEQDSYPQSVLPYDP